MTIRDSFGNEYLDIFAPLAIPLNPDPEDARDYLDGEEDDEDEAEEEEP